MELQLEARQLELLVLDPPAAAAATPEQAACPTDQRTDRACMHSCGSDPEEVYERR
jgi:hypothetical protein